MTLRLRLVLALLVLLTAGLATFGVATYVVYAHSQFSQLDDQVRTSEPLVDRLLDQGAGIGPGAVPGGAVAGGAGTGPPPGGGAPGGGGAAPVAVPPGTYGELIGPTGTVLSHIQLSDDSSRPAVPANLQPGRTATFRTLGSVSGSGQWRALASATPEGDTVVVALPTTDVVNSLHRLVLIELLGTAAVLALLSAGAWLVLRRGLAPLERMAGTAARITAGDISQRVTPAGGASEVGRLGLALNRMLDQIEAAFSARDATEDRLRQFLADASHELRTPLTSIQGFAELFRLGADRSQVDLPTIMRRIEQESDRMRELVEDLLLLARLDQTREADRTPVDLAVLAADGCSDALAADPGRPVTLDAPEPVVVLGDQAHLRQAVANLVTNAVRHTPSGTPVEVAARRDDGRAVLVVRDHGPGLDEEALAHAFDRFWQADRARAGAGAGLGLSIVEAVAAEHGGSARVTNAADGGAVFTVEIPLERSA